MGIKKMIASVVYLFDRLFPSHGIGGRGEGDDYSRWEYEIGRRIIDEYPVALGGLEGMVVLDVGCGPGGKSVAYAERAAAVFAVDISVENVSRAVAFASLFAEARSPLFLVSAAESLPFPDESFDLVVANDSMEHFEEPEKALDEMSRVVKSGGLIAVFFTPWSSPLGSHLYDYIKTPWCHLLFPEWLIEELLTVILERRGRDRAGEDASRLMGEYRSELNRITISRYRRMIKDRPFLESVHEELKPIKFGFLSPLTKVPLVGRYVVNTVVSILRKR